MAKLTKIWIERAESGQAIRLDWDNDRHHRLVVKGDEPKDLALALKEAGAIVSSEMAQGCI